MAFLWGTGMRIRTCLVSAVYRKSLVMSNYAKKDTTTGEIVNLMAVDSQRFIGTSPYLSYQRHIETYYLAQICCHGSVLYGQHPYR